MDVGRHVSPLYMKRQHNKEIVEALLPLEERKAMSEIIDKKRKARKADSIVPVEVAPVVTEELEGFTPQEIMRLVKVRADIARGRFSDITDEHRKLLFVQWLVEHDRLKS